MNARQIIEAESPKKVFRQVAAANPKRFEVGAEFGHATSHASDTIEAGMEALSTVDPRKHAELMGDEVGHFLRHGPNADFDEDYFAYEVMPGILQPYCPPFTYFGAYEADGSIGCWPWDGMALQDAVDEDKLFYVEEFRNPGQAGAIQHGNFTGITAPYAMIEMPSGSKELWDARTKQLVWKW